MQKRTLIESKKESTNNTASVSHVRCRCGVSNDMDPNYEQLSGGLSKEDPCYEALGGGGSNAGSDADPCYERVLHHPHMHHNGGRELPQMSDETNDPNYERYKGKT